MKPPSAGTFDFLQLGLPYFVKVSRIVLFRADAGIICNTADFAQGHGKMDDLYSVTHGA
jgi:hypothetical protein